MFTSDCGHERTIAMYAPHYHEIQTAMARRRFFLTPFPPANRFRP
jgi:hypothetical protein